jgi:succinate dehydrogenase/fumarate reductase flavoprotein subunit
VAAGTGATDGSKGIETATGGEAGVSAASDDSAALTSDLDAVVDGLTAPLRRSGGFSPQWVTQMLQNTMLPYYVMQVKHGDRLRAALTNVEFFRDHLVPRLYATDQHGLRLVHETRNMVQNAEMRLRASLFRTETRGCHYREDYPCRDDSEWLAWVVLRQGRDGAMELAKRPIPAEWHPDPSVSYEERYPNRVPGEDSPPERAAAAREGRA